MASPEAPLGEPRWPPITALVVLIVLNVALRLWLPHEPLVGIPWVVPALEIVLLSVLLLADPSRHASHRTRGSMRRISFALVGLLVAGALLATGLLIHDLIRGAKVAQSPTTLLADGAFVWVGNNLAFALLYWLMDGGGPISRLQHAAPVDFAFTQHLSPEIAPRGWRPFFLDYLHLELHECHGVQPDGCDAADPQSQVHDGGAVDRRNRPLRARRRACRQRVHLTVPGSDVARSSLSRRGRRWSSRARRRARSRRRGRRRDRRR